VRGREGQGGRGEGGGATKLSQVELRSGRAEASGAHIASANQPHPFLQADAGRKKTDVFVPQHHSIPVFSNFALHGTTLFPCMFN